MITGKMKKGKRLAQWAVIACCAVSLTACRQTDKPQQQAGKYETMKVGKTDKELSTAYSATIRGRQDIDIYPQVKPRADALHHRPSAL